MADGSLAGAQLLAGLLALPKSIQAERQVAMDEDAIKRAFLSGTPTAPQFETASPVGGTGTVGKILSGVGTVGSALSTALGNPIKAPRMDLGEISNVMNVGLQHDKLKNFRLGSEALARGDRDEAMRYFGAAGSIQGVQMARPQTFSGALEAYRQIAEGEGLEGSAAAARAVELYSNAEQRKADAQDARMRGRREHARKLRLIDEEADRDRAADVTAELLGGQARDNRARLPEVQRWKPDVERIATAVGVPPNLMLAQIGRESTGNPAAISPQGAVGLGQLMPKSFEAFRPQIEAITGRPANINNIEDNLYAQAFHIKENLEQANGDPKLALRYYHGGQDPDNWGPANRAYVQNVYGDYMDLEGRVGGAEPAAPAAPGAPKYKETVRVDPKGRISRTLTPVRPGGGKDDTHTAAAGAISVQLDDLRRAVIYGKGSDGTPLLLPHAQLPANDLGRQYGAPGEVVKGWVQGGRLWMNKSRVVNEANAGNADAVALTSFSGMTANLARAFGDSANISDTTEKRLKDTFDTITMSQERGAATVDRLETMIEGVLQQILANPASVAKDPSKVNQQAALEELQALQAARERRLSGDADPEDLLKQYGH